jgi:CRP/FNR family cyclic AMP-dependent transcriptional regulator
MAKHSSRFNIPEFFESTGVVHRRLRLRRGEVIFTQGEPCEEIGFIESGSVKLSVTSKTGKGGVIAMLASGDFFGEACLAGQACHTGSATAVTHSTIVAIGKREMLQLLSAQRAIADRFIAHMLARNLRSEADLVDHLFNSSEQRLARTLLLLAGFGKPNTPERVTLQISQETLAQIIGTTRSRVNVFLKSFKKRGFIDSEGHRLLRIHRSLISIVVDE